MRCDVLYSRLEWKRWILPGLFLALFALPGLALAAEIGDDPVNSKAGNRAVSETNKDRHRSGVFAQSETGPIRVKLQDAILMTLENNRTLDVERLNPLIQQTFEQQAEAEFDPTVSAGLETGEERRQSISRPRSTTETTLAGDLALEKFFSTGTTVTASGEAGWLDSSLYDDQFTTARLGLTVTQALLRGFGVSVNLATLRQARLDTIASEYELRGFSELLLNLLESAYWDYALARRQIQIVEESLRVAEQQKNETQEMITVGKKAESELVAAQSSIASRRQELIEARSTMEVARLRLLRLLNPPGPNLFKREVELLSRPDLKKVVLDDVDAHVAVALRMRPDLNQAKLGIQRGDLEVVKTKNGLLPRMDFFITLGKTGYSDSFGGSVGDISDDGYDVIAGVQFEYPLKNREASARYRRSVLSRDQAEKALENLSQLIELEVRTAYIEVDRARQQIFASAETRKLDEEQLRIETEKFRVGRSTNFLVSQAQRDLLVSQIQEVRSVASYLQALTELFRLEGSLLERRGVSAPGRQPPKQISKK